MMWSSLPVSDLLVVRDWDARRVRDETPTLEGIDVEALVFPVELLFLKGVLDPAALCVVWGDDPVRFALILEVLSKKHDRVNLFLVL